jgi:hypothetical protein
MRAFGATRASAGPNYLEGAKSFLEVHRFVTFSLMRAAPVQTAV